MTNNKNEERYRSVRQAGILGTIPFLLAVPPIAGVLIGKWIDGKVGSTPAFTIVFVILGFVAGVREVVRVLKKANQDADADKGKNKKTPDR